MDTIAVALELEDKVSSPAKRAAASLDGVEKSGKKAQKSLDFSKELEKTEKQLKRLKVDPGGYKKLVEAQRELAEHQKKLSGGEGFFGAFKGKFGEIGKIATGSFIGELFADSLIEGVKKAVEVFTEGVKKAFEAGIQKEQLDLAVNLSLGEKGGEEFSKAAENIAKRSGFDDDVVKQMLLPLRKGGFTQEGAEQAFGTATDIATMRGQGGNAGVIQGVLGTFQQIRTKQGISTKALEGILEETNVTVPEFFKKLGKKLHTSAKESEKMLGEGKVPAQMLMNMITDAVNAKTGGAAGTGEVKRGETFGARLEKLKNLPEEYLKSIADSPAWKKLSDRIGQVLESLSPDSPRGQKIVAAIMRLFERITDALDKFLTADNIDKFANGIESAIELLSSIPDNLGAIGTAAAVALIPLAGLAGPIVAAAAAAASLYNAFTKIQDTAKELGGWDRVWKDFKDWAGGDQPAVANDTVNVNSPEWKRQRANPNMVTINNHVNVTGTDKKTAKATADAMIYETERNFVEIGGR